MLSTPITIKQYIRAAKLAGATEFVAILKDDAASRKNRRKIQSTLKRAVEVGLKLLEK